MNITNTYSVIFCNITKVYNECTSRWCRGVFLVFFSFFKWRRGRYFWKTLRLPKLYCYYAIIVWRLYFYVHSPPALSKRYMARNEIMYFIANVTPYIILYTHLYIYTTRMISDVLFNVQSTYIIICLLFIRFSKN